MAGRGDDVAKAVRVRITGRVQGVGYRAWTEQEAIARGLRGWVRNRTDGSVEALIAGPESIVDDMLSNFRTGPRMAEVDDVSTVPADDPGGIGFRTLPTG
ncbi:MAG TPA: acylphosphatase [Devosia sp.]|nr:acylphosphatase [Devosia sp.]